MASNPAAQPAPIQYRLELVGAEQVDQAATSAAKSVTRIGDASQTVSRTLGDQGAAGLNNKVFALQSGFAMVAQNAQVAGVNIWGAQTAISQASSSAAGLVNALGVSTGTGLIAGGLLFGLSLAVKYFQEAKLEAAKFAAEIAKTREEMATFEGQATKLKSYTLRKERGEKFASGLLPDEEMIAQSEALRAQSEKRIFEARKKLSDAYEADKNTFERTVGKALAVENAKDEIAAAEKAKVEVEDQINKAWQAKRTTENDAWNKEQTDKAVAEMDKRDAVQLIHDQELERKRKEQEAKNPYKDYLKLENQFPEWWTGNSAFEEQLKGEVDALKQWDTEVEHYREVGYEHDRAALAEHEAWKNAAIERMAQAEIAAEERVAREKERWAQFGIGLMQQAGTALLSDIAKGKKVQLAMIAEVAGQALIADGLKNELMAAAMAVNLLNPVGVAGAGALAAAGAAEIAAGMGLVAGGSAGQGGGASAGAAGPIGGYDTTTNRRVDQYSMPTETSAPTTINVTVNTLNPSVETGRAIVDSVNQAVARDSSTRFSSGVIPRI